MANDAELHLRNRLSRLRGLGLLRGTRIKGELSRLQRQLEKISEASDEEIWQHVELARHPERPYTLDYVERIWAIRRVATRTIGSAVTTG
jgi:acetyl-CoA carboxylase carboxyl transferase subunit alpha